MRLAEHFIAFRNELNKLNTTIARMLDSIFMTYRFLGNRHFSVKSQDFGPSPLVGRCVKLLQRTGEMCA